ncbi:probable cytosolic oligopeptidase A [Argonauta hians]
MAASMVRDRVCRCLLRQSQHFDNVFCQKSLRNASYYVLLPEIPPDTADTNAVMKFTDIPKFGSITPKDVVLGAAKRAIEFETKLGNHLEHLKDPQQEKTFQSVFHPIEEVSVPLNYAWRLAKHLSYVRADEKFRESFQRVHSQVDQAKNERWISEPLYNAVKEVNADSSKLDFYQQQLVNLYLLEGRLNGIEVSGPNRKKFIDILRKLALERNNFRSKVMVCQNMFSQWVTDYSFVKNMSPAIISTMAADKQQPKVGPWQVTLQSQVYQAFLEHCHNRTLRWNVWQAYNCRAGPKHQERDLANHKIIEEIRILRQDIAKILGYDNFAHMSMETKMAGSVGNVLSMLETFKNHFKPIAKEELEELQDFAVSEGFPHELQCWDVPYWRRIHKNQYYGINESQIAQYFPLTHVLHSLFQFCETLFGIAIKEETELCDNSMPDVKLYGIYDDKGEYRASFYFDPYAHKGKISGTWMETGRERSNFYNLNPFSYLVLNLHKPLVPSIPTLMTLQEVHMLFSEFGHGLQQMLTTVPYSEIAGQRNVEWDALHICSSFMTMWLSDARTLKSLTSHYQTGDPMPDEMVDILLKGQKHMIGFDMMRQLYLSALDMELYISKDHWHSIMNNVWDEYMLLPLNEYDCHPCSFTHIFSDQHPAAYYSHKWSEMIAADIFAAFEEVGLDNTELTSAIGIRFRDTFLSMGGSMSANKIFRLFRGRDPSPDVIKTIWK